MSSATSAATDTGSPRPEQPAADAPARLTRVLSWAAAIGIGCVSRAWNVGPHLAGRSPDALALG